MSRNTGQINPAGFQSLKYMHCIHVIMMIKWFWLWLWLWLCWIYFWEVKDKFTFSVISQFWDGTRSWNHSPRKTRTCWSCIFNSMVADVLPGNSNGHGFDQFIPGYPALSTRKVKSYLFKWMELFKFWSWLDNDTVKLIYRNSYGIEWDTVGKCEYKAFL